MRILSGFLQLAGFCGLGYGLYIKSPWLAFVVCGVILLVGGTVIDLLTPKVETT